MLSLRLKRSVGMFVEATRTVTLVVTLAAVMLALFPAVAEAQAEAQTGDKSTPSMLVRPGDSLWSISEEQLGSSATPQRIANGVEQIYALNRGRIGADPNLIFVGQELLVPPTMSERPAAATRARKPTEATEVGPRDQAPRTAPGGAGAKGGEARKPAAAPVAEPATLPALPDEAAAAPVPAVRTVSSNDPQPLSSAASFLRTVRTEFASAASDLKAVAGSFADARVQGRWLLGLGLLVLTLGVAALVAWKLPMRRTTRRDAERWGMSPGYYGYYNDETPAASPLTPFGYHPGSLRGSPGDRNGQDARRGASGVLGRYAFLTGSEHPLAASIGRKADTRRHTPKARAVPRNGLALGAHNPKVRRAPLRAHATMRARKLRLRRVASRRPRPPVAFGQTKGVGARGSR